MDIIKTPWDEDTIIRLNKYQGDVRFHPYRCGNPDHDEQHGENPILNATKGGLSCPAPNCFYLQQWVLTDSLHIGDNPI